MRGLNIRCEFAMFKINNPLIMIDGLVEALECYPPDNENPVRWAYELGESERFKTLKNDALQFDCPIMFFDEPLLLLAWTAGYTTIRRSELAEVAYDLWEIKQYDNFLNKGNPSQMHDE